MRSEPISVVLASAVSIPVIFNLHLWLLSRRTIQIPNGLWNGGIFFYFRSSSDRQRTVWKGAVIDRLIV